MGSLEERESIESRGLRVEVIGITGLPEVEPGDDLAGLIVGAAERNGIGIMDMDVVVVAHKIVSKAEGRLVPLSSVVPSQFAVNLAQVIGKSPEDVEVILRESR
ncbi:MAG: coenzyme F420-0:L-glutamate ligase, partial [Conexivisphaera sp.]